MTNRAVLDLKAFVPARDYDVSRQFYRDLGFNCNFENEQLSEFELDSFRFLLQNNFVAAAAEHFMMQLMVDDADGWWTHIEAERLAEKYLRVTAKPPAMQPWGLRVLFLTDPSGVLWHIAERPLADPPAAQPEIRTRRKTVLVQNADASESHFSNANLTGSRFTNVNMRQTTFNDINLAETSWVDVNLTRARIEDANLTGMTINGILVSDLLKAYHDLGR